MIVKGGIYTYRCARSKRFEVKKFREACIPKGNAGVLVAVLVVS